MNAKVSYFDEQKKHSQYHFDSTKHDKPGEWFNVFGRFHGDWQSETAQLITNSKDINWENIAGVNDAPMTPERARRIETQELDITRGGGDPKMTLVRADTDISRFPVFAKMIDYFGLEKVRARAHVQMTGQVFNYHLDVYPHYDAADQDRLIRIIVCLEDWQPGHFYIYGTHNYSHWRAGEFHTFKWRDVPHGTANASSIPRVSLIVTGLRTEKTDSLISGQYTDYQL